ncbi:hypothetical protein [uncultured Psychrosphaera sp.]|uniref:hypothetical protein n=1 Tax=uncultured Psychrosphaera sp. TaxID=1403522 RepID=UPI002635BED6|nr:hypothetical protein [uncultured Psychrosphaera sp.]
MSEGSQVNSIDFGKKRVVELFEDNSFPPMVLVDGKWGSGKTHYVYNELFPHLNKKYSSSSCHMMSLYGVSNIEDFRDRVISVCLSGTEDTKKLTDNLIKIADATGINQSEKGIGALLKGISGAYKYSLYSNLSNKVFIFDDLERVSNPETIKNILGECFNLVDKKNNVKILVIANSEKIDAKADLEKTFHDTITIAYNPKQIVEFLKTDYPNLLTSRLDTHLVQVLNISKDINLANIRVLKRALRKFEQLQKKFIKIENISLEIANANILKAIVKICYAYYEDNYSVEEIKQNLNSSGLYGKIPTTDIFDGKSEEESETVKKERLRKARLDDILFNLSGYIYLVDFCCEGIDKFTEENIVEALNLPITTTLLDRVINYELRFRMEPNAFEQGVEDMVNYLNSTADINFIKFFNYSDFLLSFIEEEFITSPLTKDKILEICKDVKFERFDIESVKDLHWMGSLANEDIVKLRAEKKAEFQSKLKYGEQADFIESFKKSFGSIVQDLYDKYEHKPFLHNFEATELVSIFTDWTAKDIADFFLYMGNKYNFSNIEDFLNTEHKILVETTKLLSEEIKGLEPSLKKGALTNLYEVLEKINNRMKERLQTKQSE